MLKLIWLGISLFLIFIIFLQMPKEEGLANFATKSNVTGSPTSSLRFFKILITICIIVYLLLATKFNLRNN